MEKNKNIHEELSGPPNDNYRKLFEKFKEIESIEISKWKTPHVLGYFCKKYKDLYNTDYQFKFNSPTPSKCFEIFQVKKLASMLSSKPEILKEYIDWVYINKAVKAKRRLTSISFMTIEDIVNDYKINILLAGKQSRTIDRASELPENYKKILKENNIGANTYGDLAFIFQMKDMPINFIDGFKKLEEAGFNKSFLEKII